MNIVNYLDNHDIEYKGPNQRGFITLRECPFCGKTNKMYVSIEDNEWGKGFYNCYSCGNKSRGKYKEAGLIAQIEESDLKDIINKYYKRESNFKQTKRFELNVRNNVQSNEKTLIETIKSWKILTLPEGSRLIEESDREFLAYLGGRGIDFNTAVRLGVNIIPKELISPKNKRFQDRVIFPVYIGGKVYGYIARDITGEANLKVLNSSGPLTTEYLWNFDNAKKSKRIILTEGLFDAISCGVDESMAILGKSMNINHGRIKLLKAINPEEVIVYLDAGAYLDASNICSILSQELPGATIKIASPINKLNINKQNISFTHIEKLDIDHKINGEDVFINPLNLRVLKNAAKIILKSREDKDIEDLIGNYKNNVFYKNSGRLKLLRNRIRDILDLKLTNSELESLLKIDHLDANDLSKSEVLEIINSSSVYIPNINIYK